MAHEYGIFAVMDEERSRILAALEDEASQVARIDVCRLLGPAFKSGGTLLWVLGSLVGPDRAEHKSPLGFGSDATVGVAVLAQIASQLISGAVGLLEADNLYAAMALVRQLVEVEYLTWAFTEDQEEAASWLRSTKDERVSRWQPRHLYRRSQGRFRGKDYGFHCELAGHPVPDAAKLLPDHSSKLPVSFCWLELAEHGVSVWRYTMDAVAVLGYEEGYAERILRGTAGMSLTAAIARWRATDRAHAEALSWVAPEDALSGKRRNERPVSVRRSAGPACAGRAFQGRARRRSRASGAAGAALSTPGMGDRLGVKVPWRKRWC